ncbi:carboxypeptidase regulatory-like domain-containing protein [Candidatus Poribacteria bacterium]|nr:carboxypeptidase regulatory-like domain-containing protein [Candidatus Poribacteria bacterium]
MTRLNLTLIFFVCVLVSIGITFAQEDLTQQGGTVRGRIVDTTETQAPIEGVSVIIVATDGTEFTTTTDANGDYEKSGIPAGRYLISIYKDGYGDRLGKPVTVVNGGDHYVPLKMTQKDTPLDFLQSPVPMYWVLILCAIIVILIFSRTNR